jgi:hypothetical protein
MDRWVWADDGTLFEYTHIVANSALHEFVYSYEIEEEFTWFSVVNAAFN